MATKDINTEAVVTANFAADYVFVSIGGVTGPRKSLLPAYARLNAAAFSLTGGDFIISDDTNTERFRVTTDGRVYFNTYPTADPHNAGQLWVDPAAGYVVKVSQG